MSFRLNADSGRLEKLLGNCSSCTPCSVRAVCFAADTVFDAVIVVRYAHFFLQFAAQTKRLYMWLHDAQINSFWDHKVCAAFLVTAADLCSLTCRRYRIVRAR